MNFEYDLELKSWVGKMPILLVKLQSNCLKQVDHHVNVHLLPTDLSSNTLCIKLELSFSCTLQLSMCNLCVCIVFFSVLEWLTTTRCSTTAAEWSTWGAVWRLRLMGSMHLGERGGGEGS